MSNSKLEELANLIRSSKQNTPYVVLLGSGLSMTSTLLSALGCQDWNAFDARMRNRSPNERYNLLSPPLNHLDQQVGYRSLVQLLTAGYFHTLLTANFDSNLITALNTVGLSDDERDLLVVGEHSMEYIVNALARPQPRIKICLLRGRLSRQTMPNATETIAFAPQLARMLETYLAQDIIVLGSTNRDIDIHRSIPSTGGSLWYVNPEPTPSDYLIKALQRARSGEDITGEDADFNTFFSRLATLLEVQEPAPIRTGHSIIVEPPTGPQKQPPGLPQEPEQASKHHTNSSQKTQDYSSNSLLNQQEITMSSPSFSSDTEEIKRETYHIRELINKKQRNIGIVEKMIAGQGSSNIDLYFRKADLEDELAQLQNRLRDAEARERDLSSDQSLQVSIEILYTYLPSGVLSLYNPQTMPLLQYKIFNHTDQPIELVLQSEIEDFSFSFSNQVKVSPRSEGTFYQLPPLKADKVKRLTEITRAVVHTHVKDMRNGEAYTDRPNDFEVYLMARNVIRWAVPDITNESGYISLLDHIAAWVTPHTEPVIRVLRQAADYPPYNFDGYPNVHDPEFVRKQVKAIYLTLQQKVELAYIHSPFAIGPNNGEERQTVRLPNESLSVRSANCIEGAVLYASLIELASLDPTIVFLKDHAFVGWKTGADTDTYDFLDTTVTRTASFEDALDRGTGKYDQLVDDGWFNREVFDPTGFAQLLDIKTLRGKGIYPME